jgi:hypothetical protein
LRQKFNRKPDGFVEDGVFFAREVEPEALAFVGIFFVFDREVWVEIIDLCLHSMTEWYNFINSIPILDTNNINEVQIKATANNICGNNTNYY